VTIRLLKLITVT